MNTWQSKNQATCEVWTQQPTLGAHWFSKQMGDSLNFPSLLGETSDFDRASQPKMCSTLLCPEAMCPCDHVSTSARATALGPYNDIRKVNRQRELILRAADVTIFNDLGILDSASEPF